MTYRVIVTELSTGASRSVAMTGTWAENGRFWWNEGNGACDCNRHLAFHGWPELYEEDEDEDNGEFDIPCGTGRYAVTLADRPA